ncbi:MAG: signal peptidase II [Gammaproteobacteria bacterium]|nr:MAG: signal peptidase II [Gammaproteobacteria bacterium]
MSPYMPRFWWAAIVVVILDQLTKLLALHFLSDNVVVKVMPFFNFVLAFNKGAAFSFLADADGWQHIFFIVIALVVSVAIVIMARRLKPEEMQTALALMLVLGGAIGNVLDRMRLGYVVDFIDWYYRTWHWPTFNIADAGIALGAVLLIMDTVGWRILKSASADNAANST